jgi:hypothetical protein
VFAAGGERFTELLVDCGLGVILVACVLFFLMRLFGRGHGGDEPPKPPPRF